MRKCARFQLLQLYAGTAPKANVILDARASRAYVGHLENGVELFKEILPVEDLPAYFQDHPGVLYGEGELIGQTAQPVGFPGKRPGPAAARQRRGKCGSH